MSKSDLGTSFRSLAPGFAALAAVGIVLAAFSGTNMWGPLVVEVVALGVIFWLRPGLGLALAVASIPFVFAIQPIGVAEVSANDLVLWAAAAAWGARRLSAWRGRSDGTQAPRWRDRFVGSDWPVGFFLAVCLASLIVAEDKRAALWELRVLVLQPTLLYVLVRSERPSGDKLLRLGDALVFGAVALAGIGLYHYFVLQYVEAAEGVRRLLIPFYDSPNHIGLFLGRAAPVALAVAAFGRGTWRRVLHALALAAMLIAIYLTYSRGVWLVGLPAALLFVLLMPQSANGRRSPRVLLIAAGVLALGLVLLLPVARTARFSSLGDLGSGTSFLRLVLWMGTLRLIAAHPVLGTGMGNFSVQYPRFMLPEAWREPLVYHPHNLLLEFWAILGIPGLAAIAWFQAAFWRSGLGSYRQLTDQTLRAFQLGMMGSMVSFLAHGLVDTGYFLADLAMVFMLTLGITQCIEINRKATELR